MNRLLLVFILASFLLPSVQAHEIEITFYYSPGCSHCSLVSDFLDELGTEYPDIHIEKINTNEKPEDFLEIQQQYGVPSSMWSAVPKAFVDDFYCIGDRECTQDLETKVLELIESGHQTQPIENNETKEINLLQLLGLAAVDAVNPCALAVLIILLTAILTQFPDNKSKVILAGFAFTSAIFLAYFTMGLLIILGFKTITVIVKFE